MRVAKPEFSLRNRLYLRSSLGVINSLGPTIIKSLNPPHILIIADVGAWLRITQSLTFLLPVLVITQDPPSVVSNNGVVVRALRDFPSHLMIHKIYSSQGYAKFYVSSDFSIWLCCHSIKSFKNCNARIFVSGRVSCFPIKLACFP